MSDTTSKKTFTPGRRMASADGDPDLSSFVFSKIPPQARDLEEAVLGALLIDKDAVAVVVDILKPECFYVEGHSLIYSSICRLFNTSKPVDLLTVAEDLRKSGDIEKAGGAYYLAELTNRIASAANVEFHARIIAQKFIQRELIRISSDIIKQSYEDTTDVFDLLDFAETSLFSVTDNNLRRNYAQIDSLVGEAISRMEAMREHQDTLTGIPSGFTALDRITGGWQKSDLIIIAARPGMGKTSFVLSMARNAAIDFKKPVAFFSLEMSNIQLANRLISAEAEIDAQKIRNGQLEGYEWTQLTQKVETLSGAKLFIDDTPAINIFELRAKCRRLKMQHQIELIIIDYLQLMSGTNENRNSNREQEISNISRSLKSIAKELSVPVIALSQLSRETEKRTVKKPMLSDLRESGAIEQDADLVLFIYRPEYYHLDQNAEGENMKGIAEISIAKHRNGALADVLVRFVDRYAKFENLETSEYSSLRPLKDSGHGSQEGNIIIRASKMNDMKDQGDEGVPF